VAGPKQDVWCFRAADTTLALIRQLNRPGILTLRDAGNRVAYAVLAGLNSESATLRIRGEPRTVPLWALADYWRGEYATLWKVPPEYAGAVIDSRSGRSARWLALQLATARGDTNPVMARFDDAALRGWIRSFQLTQGLPSDGVAGPVTLMHLNRVVGIDEPHLLAEK
jgi:general secretion pathway protein A